MIKVSLLGRNTKTNPVSRIYRLNSKREELTQIKYPLLNFKLGRLNHLERDFEETIDNNTNNYRKIMYTYFEPYD